MIRVLIVEDEPLIAAGHTEFLNRMRGFSVGAVVGTAQEAIRIANHSAAQGNAFDLVLLDLGLPDVSGLELASALSGVRPEPDIIAISSRRDLSMIRKATSHGILMYILKPFTYATFRDKLERYLRFRSAFAAQGDAVNQHDIDMALAELRPPTRSAPTKKGTAPSTVTLVGSALQVSTTGMTASEVAKAIGISRVTAWRCLETLADDGIVTRSSEYGRTGRPQSRYSWRK